MYNTHLLIQFFLIFFFFLNCKIHQYRIEYNNIITYKTSYNLYSKVQLTINILILWYGCIVIVIFRRKRNVSVPITNQKHDDFTFPIVSFTFISSNIPAAAAYRVDILHLLRYSRACAQYSDFLDRTKLLTQKLLKQGYIAPMLKPSLQKFQSSSHTG